MCVLFHIHFFFPNSPQSHFETKKRTSWFWEALGQPCYQVSEIPAIWLVRLLSSDLITGFSWNRCLCFLIVSCHPYLLQSLQFSTSSRDLMQNPHLYRRCFPSAEISQASSRIEGTDWRQLPIWEMMTSHLSTPMLVTFFPSSPPA